MSAQKAGGGGSGAKKRKRKEQRSHTKTPNVDSAAKSIMRQAIQIREVLSRP